MEKHGPNRLPEAPPGSALTRFPDQFHNVLTLAPTRSPATRRTATRPSSTTVPLGALAFTSRVPEQ